MRPPSRQQPGRSLASPSAAPPPLRARVAKPKNVARRAKPSDAVLKWIETLEQTPSGQLMLTNLLHAFRTKRLSEQTFLALFAEVVKKWVAQRGVRADVVVETIADTVVGTPQHSAGEPLTCRSCSRVVDDKSLVANNIDLRAAAFPYVDEVPHRLLRRLERGIPESWTRNEMRGRRPFAWVTPTAGLEELRQQHADGDELAAIVRDQLGLAHYNSDHLLLEVRYPDGETSTLLLVPPSFLEGGAGVVFRARSAGDRWGRAVDLGTHDDGLPEAVHAPVPFTARFTIRRIGRIDRAPGFQFQQVVARAEYPWTGLPPDLAEFIKKLDAVSPTP